MWTTALNGKVVGSSPRSYRKDLVGFRGLAIALVVFFHVFDGRVSSGVDVFLLLGGFFFFTSQIRNSADPNGLRLWQSMARLFRKLAPVLVLVAATATTCVLLLSGPWTWGRNLSDTVAAVGYYMNWRLISAGQTYGEAGHDVSVFQHLWSMSAQMQVYVGAFIVFAVGTFLLNWFFRPSEYSETDQRRYTLMKAVTVALLALLTILSFCYAAYMVNHNQTVNYYSTLSRFWEIGLGGLAGIFLAKASVPSRMTPVVGAVGLSLIMVTPFVIDGVNEFPGPWTLVPLTGAILVVLAGQTDGPQQGVNRILEAEGFQFMGKIAYSLYLWHWPVLILLMVILDLETHSVSAGLVVVVLSVGLAAATYRWVELPLQEGERRRRMWPSISRISDAVRDRPLKASAGVFITLAAIALLLSEQMFNHGALARAHAINSAAMETHLGALALDGENVSGEVENSIAPDVVSLKGMFPQTQLDGCYNRHSDLDLTFNHEFGSSAEPCLYGDSNSDRQLYLVGGSHSEQYLPALDAIGKSRSFAVVPILKMGCPLNLPDPLWDGEPYTQCSKWSDAVREWIVENPPSEGVFMTSTRPRERDHGGGDVVPNGYVEAVEDFSEAGIKTFGVRDNPWPQHAREGLLDVRICVAEGHADCGFEDPLESTNPAEVAYRGLGMRHIDLHDRFCIEGYCPAVIGDVLVYRDSHHITNLYALTLTEELDRRMYPDGDTTLAPTG